MDIIYIDDLKATTWIGTKAWEQQIPQTVVLHLEIAIDAKTVAKNDDLKDAVDYSAISSQLVAYLETARYKLIESLAENTAEWLLKQFNLTWLRLRIRKIGAIPGAKEVGIIIERSCPHQPLESAQ